MWKEWKERKKHIEVDQFLKQTLFTAFSRFCPNSDGITGGAKSADYSEQIVVPTIAVSLMIFLLIKVMHFCESYLYFLLSFSLKFFLFISFISHNFDGDSSLVLAFSYHAMPFVIAGSASVTTWCTWNTSLATFDLTTHSQMTDVSAAEMNCEGECAWKSQQPSYNGKWLYHLYHFKGEASMSNQH